MTRTRQDIIADTLKTELGSQVGSGLRGLDEVDLDSLAKAINAALVREGGGEPPHDEGVPTEDLSSANDG